ncbi:MAG: hypothetical protein LBD90_09920, partial [Bifidobacteriaceae bacterium]|nr:hypothetical protein [Bifidobacteriaceae bacterium]
IDYGALKGKAVDAYKQSAQELADLLAQAEGRYAVAPQALDTFAQVLREQQQANAALLADAATLAGQLAAAKTVADNADRKLRRLDPDADATARSDAKKAAANADHDVELIQYQLNTIRTDIETSADTVQAAAQTAAIQLQGAMNADGLTDSFWDNVTQGVLNGARWIDEWVTDWAVFFSAAALMLGWVPYLGQFLLAVDLVLNTVVLLADLALAIAGEQGWGDVIVGVIGLLTYGAGRVAAKGFQMARGALSTTARVYADATRTLRTVTNQMPTSSYANARRLFGQGVAAARRWDGLRPPTLRDALAGMRGHWLDDLRWVRSAREQLDVLRHAPKHGGGASGDPILVRAFDRYLDDLGIGQNLGNLAGGRRGDLVVGAEKWRVYRVGIELLMSPVQVDHNHREAVSD